MDGLQRILGRLKLRPGLKLISLIIVLIILAMPISGLYLFRIYENELVRQTETELIVQGGMAAALFKKEILRQGGPNYGLKLSGVEPVPEGKLLHINPSLDLSRDEILPQGVYFRSSPYEPDQVALSVGADLDDFLSESRRITLSSVYILDYQGFVVAGPNGHGLSLADVYEVSEALAGRYQSVLRARKPRKTPSISSVSRRANFYVFYAMPIMHGDRLLGVVHLSRTPRDIFQALKQEEHNVYWAAGLSLGLVAVVIIIVSLMIINPVKRLAKEANAVAEGRRRSLGRQTSPLVVRELTDLRLVVAEMAERLRHRSDYLKAFASGVSHEFKTPLAAIKGAMELLGEHGPNMPPETRARFENNILADLDRLERLVTQLLTLARAEAQAEDAPLLAQESQTEAAGLIQRLQTHYQATGYTVAAEGLRPLKLAISEDVLETVLRNLLDNSRDAPGPAAR